MVAFIKEDELASLLPAASLLSAVEKALAGLANGDVINGGKISIPLDDADGQRILHGMAGVLLNEGIAGIKWVGGFNDNPRRGLPRAPATVLLTDSVTGTLLAVVEATALTAMRTAAAGVVAAKHCTSRPVSRIAILGFGAIGSAVVPLAMEAFKPSVVSVWGGAQDQLQLRAEKLAPSCAARFEVCGSAAEASAGADIVFTASGLTENLPFLTRDMVSERTVICAMGSYQEVAEDVIAEAGMIVVDDWLASTKRGSLGPVIASGKLEKKDIECELSQLVARGGLRGRTDIRQPCVFMLGLGALDVAICAALLRARK